MVMPERRDAIRREMLRELVIAQDMFAQAVGNLQNRPDRPRRNPFHGVELRPPVGG